MKVLAYPTDASGWSEDLTVFHEDTAGDDHYIDRASRQQALDSLFAYLRSATPTVMDIGCSSGFMLRLLRERYPNATVLGADYICGPLYHLATQILGIPLFQFDLTRCPLPEASLDAVVLLNVLEHIEDDVAAIAHLFRILKPGGVAVIEVPAGPELFDVYDHQLMHHRRYRMPELVQKLEAAGLCAQQKSHLGCFLYPGFWIVKRWGRRHLKRDDKIQRRIVADRIKTGRASRLLSAVMSAEGALRKRIYYPFGIRCLVTCIKP